MTLHQYFEEINALNISDSAQLSATPQNQCRKYSLLIEIIINV